jgi:hypothetical protein
MNRCSSMQWWLPGVLVMAVKALAAAAAAASESLR